MAEERLGLDLIADINAEDDETRCDLSAICQQNVRELDETGGNQTTPADIESV